MAIRECRGILQRGGGRRTTTVGYLSLSILRGLEVEDVEAAVWDSGAALGFTLASLGIACSLLFSGAALAWRASRFSCANDKNMKRRKSIELLYVTNQRTYAIRVSLSEKVLAFIRGMLHSFSISGISSPKMTEKIKKHENL